MRLHLAALAFVPLLSLPVAIGAAGPARADTAAPTIESVSYKVAANADLLVSADVSGETASAYDLEFGIADDSGAEVDVSATLTPTSATAYRATATVEVSSFPDGDKLYVGAEAEDSDGGEDSYEDDSRTVTVDRTPPTVTLTGPTGQAVATTALAIAVSDNLPGVTTTCSVDGKAAVGCAGYASASGALVGKHTVTVTATDVAGNTASAIGTVFNTQSTTLHAGFTSGCGCRVGDYAGLRVTSQALSDTGVAPGGSVTVSEGGLVVGSATLTPTYPAGVSAADVLIKAGAIGSHALQVSYSGDATSLPSTTTASYVSLPSLRAVLKPGKVVRGRLQLAVLCPSGSTSCGGFIQLGKAKAHYVVRSGHSVVVALALPAAVATALRVHHRETLKLLFADSLKHSTVVVHLH